MQEKTRHSLVRLSVHVLLAAFLANAANKFFVADLDYEFANGFYAKIFVGLGDAPDQYRILPLAPLKLLCNWLPFNHAVLLYNLLFSFLAFELFWRTMGGLPPAKKYAFNLLLALSYIFLQYSGWRPDTMGLLVVCGMLAFPGLCIPVGQPLPRSILRDTAITLLLISLAFSRSDVALLIGAFYAIYQTKSWPLRLLWLALPIAIQYCLQTYLFPDAEYYSDRIMLGANLSGYYFARHPGSYLLLALAIVYRRAILRFIRETWAYRWYYLLLLGYLGLVLVVGRINEYRLYLPFVPILLVIWRENSNANGTEADPV